MEAFDLDVSCDNDDFLFTMDEEGQGEAELACFVCGCWADVSRELTCHGPILEFRTAWLDREFAGSGLWVDAANHMIEEEFSDHSILMIKAFPLEYENRCPEGTPESVAMRKRRKAMIRLYRRLFDVALLPGPAADDGWLWRPNPRFASKIPAPLGGGGWKALHHTFV